MIALLRLEGLALFAAALAGYVYSGGGWLLFLVLFLAPDLSMAGYLAGPRIAGAAGPRPVGGFGDGAAGRAGLAGAYRHRPRARLWTEAYDRLRRHASRADRPG